MDSVDLLRGLIMVIMMLDHTRDFVHFQPRHSIRPNVTRTYPLLFFTRWITHFCAPIFVFPRRDGCVLPGAARKTEERAVEILVTRGIWLIVLEFTVLRVIIFSTSTTRSSWLHAGDLGDRWGMIVLAGLIYLPLRVILVLSVAMIGLHNALDGIHSTSWGTRNARARVSELRCGKWLHEPGAIFHSDPDTTPVLYPLIPWIGVLAAG